MCRSHMQGTRHVQVTCVRSRPSSVYSAVCRKFKAPATMYCWQRSKERTANTMIRITQLMIILFRTSLLVPAAIDFIHSSI